MIPGRGYLTEALSLLYDCEGCVANRRISRDHCPGVGGVLRTAKEFTTLWWIAVANRVRVAAALQELSSQKHTFSRPAGHFPGSENAWNRLHSSWTASFLPSLETFHSKLAVSYLSRWILGRRSKAIWSEEIQTTRVINSLNRKIHFLNRTNVNSVRWFENPNNSLIITSASKPSG